MVNTITNRNAKGSNIGNFIYKHALGDACVIAGRCGAIEAIVNMIKTYKRNPDICRVGCDTLNNITANNSKCHHLQSHSRVLT